jgi:hypothetical protein
MQDILRFGVGPPLGYAFNATDLSDLFDDDAIKGDGEDLDRERS